MVMAVLIVCLVGALRWQWWAGVGGVGGVGGGLNSRAGSVGASGLRPSRDARSARGAFDAGAVSGCFGAFAVSLGGACRSSCWLWVLDMVCLSVICLEVNHAESLYWVLVAAFVGTLAWSMGGSAGWHPGSLRSCAPSGPRIGPRSRCQLPSGQGRGGVVAVRGVRGVVQSTGYSVGGLGVSVSGNQVLCLVN